MLQNFILIRFKTTKPWDFLKMSPQLEEEEEEEEEQQQLDE